MTTVLGRSAAIAGLLLTLSKLIGAFAEIAIGTISDRTRSSMGRRRPFLLAGALIGGLSFLLIFIVAVCGAVCCDGRRDNRRLP